MRQGLLIRYATVARISTAALCLVASFLPVTSTFAAPLAPLAPAPPEFTFAIAAGPLDQAIAAFESTTGFTVTVADGVSLRVFTSPGVTGVHSAEMAIERLLAGTSLRFRLTAARTYALEVEVAPERVDVTAR